MQVKIEVPKSVIKRVVKALDVDREQIISEWLQSQCDTEIEIVDAIIERNDGKVRKKRLIALGFDLSTKHRVKCSQCNATVINGSPCHETGCISEVWECKGCGALVAGEGSYCIDCS